MPTLFNAVPSPFAGILRIATGLAGTTFIGHAMWLNYEWGIPLGMALVVYAFQGISEQR